MGKFWQDMMTGIDNQTYDVARVGGLVGLIVFLGLEIFVVVWKNVPFDMQAFGIAFGAMIAAIGAGIGFKAKTEPGERREKGFVRLGIMALIVALALVVSFTFYGCKTAAVLEQIPHPIETVTVQGAPVQEIQPPATMDRQDVPVGVDPDKVILHVSDSAGNEVWSVKTGFLGLGKPRTYTKAAVAPAPQKGAAPVPPVDDLKADIAKPSRAWIWWLAGITGIFALLWFGNKAVTGFLGFNPIAMIGGIFAGIVEKLTPQAKKATTGIESLAKAETSGLAAKLAASAPGIESKAETAATGILASVCAKVKAIVKKLITSL